MIRPFIIILLTHLIFQLPGYSQESAGTIRLESYLLRLNIPQDWEIKKDFDGDDYILSAYNPDNTAFVYYCQFMEDDKSRPKVYFKTYTNQFGINNKPRVVNKIIDNKRTKFFYSDGEGELMGEKYNIIFLATSIEETNVIAYLVYPLDAVPDTRQDMEKIMLLRN